jgi:hypothetical protein
MMASGGMPMVMKDGKSVPAFAADGKGKMASGGMTKDDQFDADVKRVKSSSYMNKNDDRVYSRERGLSPGIAGKRLSDRGVDVKGLAGNRANSEDLGSYKRGGMSKMMASGGMSKMMASGGMHRMPDGKMMKDSAMAKGGMPKALKEHAAKPASKAHAGLKSGGMAKMMSSGGSASKRADGVATKGKTKGKMFKKGGMAC